MTDCNGATLGVGDVVEVVAGGPVAEFIGHARVSELSNGKASLDEDGHPAVARRWFGWFDTKQLRLVRRKEQA